MLIGGFTGIGLEVIGVCNARCEFCSWGHNQDVVHKNVYTDERFTRSKNKISIELVDKIFEYHPIKHIIFTGLCEPLLAPDRVFYVADKLKERGGSFSIYTNASLLNDSVSEKLLSYDNFSQIHFSMNAIDNDTRMKVMQLSLEPSETNALNFLKLRRSMNKESQVSVGIVHMLTPHNIGTENEFRDKWKRIFAKYSNCNEPGLFHTTSWGGEADCYWVRLGKKQYCSQWNGAAPTISVDGYLYPCCYNTHIVLGHCLNQDDVTKWNNRREVFNVKVDDPESLPSSICGNCSANYMLTGMDRRIKEDG